MREPVVTYYNNIDCIYYYIIFVSYNIQKQAIKMQTRLNSCQVLNSPKIMMK